MEGVGNDVLLDKTFRWMGSVAVGLLDGDKKS